MKGLFALVSLVITCDHGTPSCTEAIEKAFKTVGLDGAAVTMSIGTCEQKQWPKEARECVVAASGDAALDACAAKHGIELPSSADAMLAKTNAFRDQLCACSDTACVQAVRDEMTKWGDEQRTRREPVLSEAQKKRATQLGADIGLCISRALASGSKMPF